MRRVWAFAFGLLVLNCLAVADPRPFTLTYDAYPMGKGGLEYEQWVTFNADKESESDFQEFEFLHELEYGISDNFDLGLYFLRWKYEDSQEESGTSYDGAALE